MASGVAWDERNDEGLGEGAYVATGPYPGEPASISARSVLRQTPVARIVIHPFQWDAGTGTLRICERVRLRVTFEGRWRQSRRRP